MAKTLSQSFGHSECNRVKQPKGYGVLAILSVIEFRMAKTLWSFGQFSIIGLEWPKQYGVLAILSAVGLKE